MSEKKGSLKELYPIVIFGIALIAVIAVIISNISVFSRIFIIAIGFGAVILVHEFGHFLLAKLNDIKVEAFSIGFPPVLVGLKRTENGWRVRILPDFVRKNEEDPDKSGIIYTLGKKAKAGETEYRFGLIPFGGFVKMLGQEDTKAVEATDDPRSYMNKSVWQRMSVIAAGVIFNVVSAAIIFMIVFMVGIKMVPPIVGGVNPGSPAAKAGIRAGDEVLSIDGKSYNLEFSSISMAAALSGRDEKVAMEIRHADGSEETVEMVAEEMAMGNAKLKLFGVMPPESLEVARVKDANMLTRETGLKGGDVVKAVNGRDLESRWDFDVILKGTYQPEVAVLAERRIDGESKLVETTLPLELLVLDEGENLAHIYGFIPRLRINSVGKEVKYSSEKEGKLNVGDVILSAGGVENPTYKELRDLTEKSKDKAMELKVLRVENGRESNHVVNVVPIAEGGLERVTIGIGICMDASRPIIAKTVGIDGGAEIPTGSRIVAVDGVGVGSFYDVIHEIEANAGNRISVDYRLNDEVAGAVAIEAVKAEEGVTADVVLAKMIPFEPLERIYKASGPLGALVMGVHRTGMFVTQAYVTLQRAVSGQVSPKNFMGPVGIIGVSWQIVSERSLLEYAYFLALISAFIAVFNFLPILPFDGGHIVFLLVEKIKGSPASEKVQEMATYVGLFLVGALFLYVTFNDIIRSIRNIFG